MNCVLLPADIHQKPIIDNPKQVKHIKEVLQSEIGDRLVVGELNTNLGHAVIQEIDNDKIVLTDIVLDTPPPEKLELTVVLALPRPKVLRRLIMDMTALGVNKIILLNSYRTQKSYWQSPLLNRIDEFVLDGLQQAVDTIPPVIELKKRFKPFVEDEFLDLWQSECTPSSQHQFQAVVAHPYTKLTWKEVLTDLRSNNHPMPKVICIGAEGGWIDYEVSLFSEHGCQAVSLGNRILRTEAVVNVLLGGWLS